MVPLTSRVGTCSAMYACEQAREISPAFCSIPAAIETLGAGDAVTLPLLAQSPHCREAGGRRAPAAIATRPLCAAALKLLPHALGALHHWPWTRALVAERPSALPPQEKGEGAMPKPDVPAAIMEARVAFDEVVSSTRAMLLRQAGLSSFDAGTINRTRDLVVATRNILRETKVVTTNLWEIDR
jgi:hypothetical protein